jgi:hypothetical protein
MTLTNENTDGGSQKAYLNSGVTDEQAFFVIVMNYVLAK